MFNNFPARGAGSMGDPPAKQNKKVNIKGIVKLEKRAFDTVVSFEPLDFEHYRR